MNESYKEHLITLIQELGETYSYLFDAVEKFVSTKEGYYQGDIHKLLVEDVYALARAERENRLK